LIAGCAARRVLPADGAERQHHRILEELALARSDGQEAIADVLVDEARRFDRNRVPVVVTASLDRRWVGGLRALTARGVRPIGIFIDPGSFDPAIDSSAVIAELREQRFAAFVVDFTEGIDAAFSPERHRPSLDPLVDAMPEFARR
jgi:hypothetical protein